MDAHMLLPKNKFDDSTLTELMSLSDNEIEPIITDLLEWLQDFNWPIATKIKSVVGKHYKLSEPYVLSILQGTDEIWKYWILRELMYEWQSCPGSDLLNEISRIAQHPTPDEIEEELDKAANELLMFYQQEHLWSSYNL